MPWWFRFRMRGLIAVLVGVGVAALFALSPVLWDTALLAGWDAGVIVWLVLTYAVISRADAQRTWEQEQALEPETARVLVVVIVTAVAGLLGAADHPRLCSERHRQHPLALHRTVGS